KRDAGQFGAGLLGDRPADLLEHRKALFGRKQRRFARMDADRQHQTVAQPGGLPHHVQMAVGDGVERASIERGSGHCCGLSRYQQPRKVITDRSRNLASSFEPFAPISRLTGRRGAAIGTGGAWERKMFKIYSLMAAAALIAGALVVAPSLRE